MSEYGEPFEYDGQFIIDKDGNRMIGEDQCERCYLTDDFAERVVGCLNACADIPTERLNDPPGDVTEFQSSFDVMTTGDICHVREPASAWRKEPPDKPGHWWMLPPGNEPITTVVRFLGDLLMVYFGSTLCETKSKFLADCFWAGPFEPPEPPQ